MCCLFIVELQLVSLNEEWANYSPLALGFIWGIFIHLSLCGRSCGFGSAKVHQEFGIIADFFFHLFQISNLFMKYYTVNIRYQVLRQVLPQPKVVGRLANQQTLSVPVEPRHQQEC